MQQVLMEVRLYGLMARQSGRQPAVALANPAGNRFPSPLPLTSSGKPVADIGLPAQEGEPTAIVPPMVQLHNVTDAQLPPKLRPALDPRWFVAPGGPAESSPLSDIKCPFCGGGFVYPSRPRNRLENLLKALGIQLNRCHRCFYRYVTVLGMVFQRRASFY
jgi:hypothetical protein